MVSLTVSNKHLPLCAAGTASNKSHVSDRPDKRETCPGDVVTEASVKAGDVQLIMLKVKLASTSRLAIIKGTTFT